MALSSAADIAAAIIAQLALSEPTLDTSIGTVARKIIDAVATSQAEVSVDNHLVAYRNDIDSKNGGDLDDFVATYGMSRFWAGRASGIVTFSRAATVAAQRSAAIPIGTQIVALSTPPVYVQTTVNTVLNIGQVSVDVPVQAVSAGSTGNVGAGLLQGVVSDVDNVGLYTTNALALANGSDPETDAQLRDRFKSTVFRNLAGTESMYRAMALQVLSNPADPNSRPVSQVNVLGSATIGTEQINIVAGVAVSSLTSAAYIYPDSIQVGRNLSQADVSGNIFTPTTQYTVALNTVLNAAGQSVQVPTVTVVSGIPDGLYDLSCRYVSVYSRNDPLSLRWGSVGAYINNRVDVWVNGTAPVVATQACVFTTSPALRFTTVASDPLYLGRFVKLNGDHPSDSDVFVPLAFGPVLSVPSPLSVGSSYTLGTHYDIVHQSDAFGYAPNSRFGLVWYKGTLPPSNTSFSITYDYNAVPRLIQTQVENSWRLLGTDVWYHAAKVQLVKVHLAVVFTRNADVAMSTTALTNTLTAFINGLGFSAALQVSDILAMAHNVAGVDNVRLLTSTDDLAHYGIELMNPDGSAHSVWAYGGRAQDLYFDDSSYPQLNSVRIVVKAKNTFGVA